MISLSKINLCFWKEHTAEGGYLAVYTVPTVLANIPQLNVTISYIQLSLTKQSSNFINYDVQQILASTKEDRNTHRYLVKITWDPYITATICCNSGALRQGDTPEVAC